MKRHLLVFAAALIALLVLGLTFSKADAKCYIDPFTGQKICPLKAKASAVVQSVPFKPGEVSVVVRRVAHKPCKCRCAVRQVSKCWRPRFLRRCR